jgi:DNA-binding beta-propeller fold protein YncE
VTYNGNGNTGGSVPTDGNKYMPGATVTVLGNTGTMVVTGSVFLGWNTQANGSGTTYTPGQTFTMGTSNVTLYAVWSSPSLYVTNNGSSGANGISAYSIGFGGALSAITTGTFATGSGPAGVAISPNGNYLYVTNFGSSGANGISAYTIGSGGVLTAGTFTTGSNPYGIAISPNGSLTST